MAKLSDAELLAMVADERRAALGFDQGELNAERETALNYAKGVMSDLSAMPNRSKAVSTDVNDAVETALPDLVEIFTGGDDVVVFPPAGPDDEKQARLETDYVNHVFFDQNDGFMVLYSLIKDALLSKIGVATWYYEPSEDVQEQVHEGLHPDDAAVAAYQLQQQGHEIEHAEADDGSVTLTARKTVQGGKLCVETVPPEDYGVSRDATKAGRATYSFMRSRRRVQELIAEGYDPDLVRSLPPYGSHTDQSVELARDTVEETAGAPRGDGIGDLKLVEIVCHYLRVDADGDGDIETLRLVTGADETVLLDKAEVDGVRFAVITPYPVTHRLIGRSLADLLLEVQRIKTALLRMFLDSGYFALNQRYEVATDPNRANQFTLGDLLRNEPGVPVRSKSGDSVRPITAGSLNFPALDALEYMSTVGEQRTGIVRNAQGLNPDTLHDTASGAAQLIGAAQKRLRLIARVFAETGIKDMFLGIHACLRANAQAGQARLRGEWAEVDPSQWRERTDMNVEVGVGAGGREHEMQVGQMLMATTEKLVTLQGGLNGPFVQAPQAHAVVKRFYERGLGLKSADPYLGDPAKQQQQPQQPPAPDPKLIEVQVKADLERQKMESDAQLKREQMAGEFALKREQMQFEAKLKLLQGSAMSPVHMGGEPG